MSNYRKHRGTDFFSTQTLEVATVVMETAQLVLSQF